MEPINFENSRNMFDTLAHNLSLQVASLYHYGKAMGLIGEDNLEDLLQAYRNIRRAMWQDPVKGARVGSREAYLAMMGLREDGLDTRADTRPN